MKRVLSAFVTSSQQRASEMETDKEMFGSVTDRDQELCFVAFGPTGSGKTTLMNYMTAKAMKDIEDMKGGAARVSTDSMTTKISKVISPKIRIPESDASYVLKFWDTPGHGAKDQEKWVEGSLMASTLKQLLEETGMLNGVILVLKMERFRSDLEQALKEYITMFKKFELNKDAFLVVITHSMPFKEEVKDEYTKKIVELFQDHVLANNVIHVNVAMLEEMAEDFQVLYKGAIKKEVDRFREHLWLNFRKEYNIRHWFDKERGLNQSIDRMFPKRRR